MISEQDIPDYWDLLEIDDVISKAMNGGTPTRSNPEYWEGDVPWLSSSEVRGKYTTSDPEEYITQKGLDESSAVVWPSGTVLVAMYGRGTIGRPAITSSEISGNQAICGLVVDKTRISADFLYYWLENIRDELAYKGRGATASQQNLNQTIIRETKVPVPPLEEQKSIVEAVEAQIGGVTQLNESVNKLSANIDEYNHSLRSFLFAGRKDLSTGNVSDEIQRDEIPPHWEVMNISSVSNEIRTGGTPTRSRSEFWGGSTEWRTSRHFSDDSLTLKSTDEYVSDKGRKKTTIAREGDVLLVTRVNVGKVALVQSETGINQDIKVLRLDTDRVLPEFVARYLLNMRGYFKSIERGGTVNGITTEHVKELNVPLPPLAEQKDIVERLKTVHQQVEKADETITTVYDLFEEYQESVLSHAFRGEISEPSKKSEDSLIPSVE